MLIDMGKGLSSLLSDTDLVVSNKVAAYSGVKLLALALINTNPYQPRTDFEENALNELAASIKVHGLIQPITVREKAEGRYELISGERRYRASKLAGLQEVPAYVRNVDDQRSLEMALIENIQREDLNAIEVALTYKRMIDECQLKQEDLGQRVGKNRTTVNNYLRLLQLPEQIQSAIVLGKLTMGQARPLVSLEDKVFQIELFQRIINQGLSARKVEELVKAETAFTDQLSPIESFKEDMRIEEMSLKGKTKVPVKIKVSDTNKGFVSIAFEGEEDLNKILESLSSH